MAKNEPNKPDNIKTEPGKEQATPDTGPVEAGGKPAPDNGEVVVPFDKINEIVSDKKAAAKEAEQAAPDKAEPEAPAKKRGGRPPKADKAEKEPKAPKAEKADKPPKAPKKAPAKGEAPAPEPPPEPSGKNPNL